ncbi:MAG: DinB family protein [Bacteroidota bacterium]
MKQIPWFERKFDFSYQQNIFPAIIERLEGTSLRLRAKVAQVPAAQLTRKPAGNWSIKEHIGHLTDLEPLWQGRLADVLAGERYLREADLTNRGTDQAGHNETDLQTLLDRFEATRSQTLTSLRSLTESEVRQSALHPRLEQPMRIMDLFLFVAEHDDHHLVFISQLKKGEA